MVMDAILFCFLHRLYCCSVAPLTLLSLKKAEPYRSKKPHYTATYYYIQLLRCNSSRGGGGSVRGQSQYLCNFSPANPPPPLTIILSVSGLATFENEVWPYLCLPNEDYGVFSSNKPPIFSDLSNFNPYDYRILLPNLKNVYSLSDISQNKQQKWKKENKFV